MGGGSDYATAIASGVQSAADIVKTASGAYAQQARASRDTMLAARANAGSASERAAADIRIAEINAEIRRLDNAAQAEVSNKKTVMIAAAVGGVALLGVLGFVLLKK